MHCRTRVYSAPLTAFPNWVYEMYSSQVLVESVHNILGTLKLFSHAQLKVPTDPIELSFWVASNFPLTNQDKIKLLNINNCVQRLRHEIDVLKRVGLDFFVWYDKPISFTLPLFLFCARFKL